MTDRRALALALVAALWLLGLELLGVDVAIAYLTPALLIVLPLLGGHYPGEEALLRAARRRIPRPRRHPLAGTAARRVERPLLPRGGCLVSAALAGRGPPPRIARPT